MQTYIDKLEVGLQQSRSVRGALFRFLEVVRPLGVDHLTYVFMLHRSSYKRGDQVAAVTFPEDVSQYYWTSGGMLTDVLMEITPLLDGHASMRFDRLVASKRVGYKGHPYFAAIAAKGWPMASCIPIFMEDGTSGLGALGVITSLEHYTRLPDFALFMELARYFQRGIKTHGQLRHYYSLTDKEKLVLEHMAKGATAAEIAETLGLQTRTIEMRLQSARKKLRALTTTEAVFKATAYSIIFV